MKKHQDEAYLREAIANGLNSRNISAELGVSYKLVELYLEKYQIPFTSMAPVVSED
jgi:hypothetical protein